MGAPALTKQPPAAPLRPSNQSRVPAVWAWIVRTPATALAVTATCSTAALLGSVGADARWLAAMGRAVIGGLGPSDGVPFASAPSDDWPNVLIAAEVIFHWLIADGGERALVAAQLVAVGLAFGITAASARRQGGTDAGVGLAVGLAFLGAIPAIAVARLQLFSLVLFPLVAALLRAETVRPSRRVWLLVPLFALWSNLHGAVLIGLAVAAAYLVLGRLRREPIVAAAALLGSAAAVCATPALLDTPRYYAGVLDNEAARRGYGLWADVSLRSGFDVLLVLTGLALIALTIASRPRLWELVAIAGLAVGTALTARSGVWLLLFAAAPAARAVRTLRGPGARASGAVATALLVTFVFGIVRGPVPSGAGDELVREALRASQGTPVLAEGILAEQIALAGGSIWMGNPLDAFSHEDQRLYLDWLQGRPSGDRAVERAPRAVLVVRDSPAQLRTAARGDLSATAEDDDAILYVRLP